MNQPNTTSTFIPGVTHAQPAAVPPAQPVHHAAPVAAPAPIPGQPVAQPPVHHAAPTAAPAFTATAPAATGTGKTARKKIILPLFRLSYPSLQETAKFQGQDTGKYEITCMFPPEADLAELNAAVLEIGQETFGPQFAQMGLKTPLKPTAAKPRLAAQFPNYHFAKAKSNRKVPQVLAVKEPDPVSGVERWKPATAEEMYGGCWCIASVNVFSYLAGGGGVALGLLSIQKYQEGEPFGGSFGNPDEDFTEVSPHLAAGAPPAAAPPAAQPFQPQPYSGDVPF